MPTIDVTDLYPPRQLFASQDEAYRELMRVAVEVIRDIRQEGLSLPPVSKMSKDIDRLFEVWKLFAPKGHHGTSPTA